ncbi:MAG: AtpZ/AtpI family protein [Pseudomonadota bacterium]
MKTGENKPDPVSGRKSTNVKNDLETRRQSLEAKIAARVKTEEDKAEVNDAATAPGVAKAFKLSSEFIAGVVAGAGLGYLIDTFAGTTPWGMIIFLLMGFAAGVLNVLRSSGLVAQADYAKPANKRDDA